MRSYSTARLISTLLEWIAWGMVVVGIIVVIGLVEAASQYSRGGATLMTAMPGIAISIFGMFQVTIVQNARASVDTAEYTQQMLKVARDQLEVSKQGLKHNHAQGGGFQLAEPVSDDTSEPGFHGADKEEGQEGILDYAGHTIILEEGSYRCAQMSFSSLEKAKGYIDQLDINPKVESTPATIKS